MVNNPMTTINNNKWYILYEQHEREREREFLFLTLYDINPGIVRKL